MKKIIILVLTIIMIGCVNPHETVHKGYSVYTIDSCEYIKIHDCYGFNHKGNCKYCAEKRKQELQELIKAMEE